jgi:renalase
VTRIDRDALAPSQWQLQTSGPGDAVHVYSGFDAVILALPHAQASELLQHSNLAPAFTAKLQQVQVAPCWTLMLAYPHAAPTLIAASGAPMECRTEHPPPHCLAGA